MDFYDAVCRWCPDDHPLAPLKFSKATPRLMLSSYLRVLDPETGVVPSSARIIQDVKKCWGTHLDAICEERGGPVEGLGSSRTGVRKIDGLEKRGGKRVKQEWQGVQERHPDLIKFWDGFVAWSKGRHQSNKS